jgi:hypothetical protein
LRASVGDQINFWDFFQILVRVPIGFLLERFESLNKSA